MQQPYTHQCLPLLIGATVQWQFHSLISSSIKTGSWSLTFISPQAFIFRLLGAHAVIKWHLFLWFAACLCAKTRTWACKCEHLNTCVRARFRVTAAFRAIKCDAGEARKLDWRCLKDNGSLAVGAFSTQWTGRNWKKALGEKQNHQSSHFFGEMSKGSVSALQMRLLCLSSQLNTVWPTSYHKERETITRIEREWRMSRLDPTMSFFFTQTSCFKYRTGFSFQADAFGITLILTPQAAHEIISARSFHQGFVSGFIPSRWQNWQQRLDLVFIERANKRNAIHCWLLFPQINYRLGLKNKHSHHPKSNKSRGTVHRLRVKVWRRKRKEEERKEWFSPVVAHANQRQNEYTHRHSQTLTDWCHPTEAMCLTRCPWVIDP